MVINYFWWAYLFVCEKERLYFSNRSEEEKEYLAKNGYLEAFGKLFNVSFWIFLITFILGFLPIPYGFEVGLAVFILILMIGIVFVQRYEVPHKRKKKLWMMSSISAATILFIAIIVGIGYI